MAAKKKEKKTISVEDILQSATTAPSKTAKAPDVATVSIKDDKELNERVVKFAEASRKKKAAEASMKNLGPVIREEGFKNVVLESKKANSPLKSVNLESTGGAVQVSVSYASKDIDVAHEKMIQESCGEVGIKYGEHFKNNQLITLKDKITQDELRELIEVIVEKFGPAGFAKYFQRQTWICPTDKFYNGLVQGDEPVTKLYEKLGPKGNEKIITMNSPSLELVVSKEEKEKAKQEAALAN